jgi:hypothetical protein
MKTKTSSYRLEYLDWVRGLGALIMLQGHVFDSFLKNDLRGGAPYVFSQFAGGMPPAIFLFLTGVTLAFLMDSSERKGYLFLVAFVFRLQLWLFSQPAPWTDLLKVDILNCMGLAIALLSTMALFRTAERVRHCAVVGLAIAFASPLISQLDGSFVPALVRNYFVPDYRFFSFFPWAAYLAFGMSAGSLIRIAQQEAIERAMQWAAIIGGALILACQYFSNLPFSLYAKSEYWLNSPAQVLSKLGVTLLLLALAFLWTRYAPKNSWSWVRQFGTTSLLVYWVHIELVYGHWMWFWKNGLNVGQTVAAAAGLIVLMLVLSTARTNAWRLKNVLSESGWSLSPKPRGAAGD